MEYRIAENIQKALENLEYEICRDNYNLTQDDHDAILVKLQKLKKFIQERYDKRRSLDE